jgi:hypothetical protein
MNINTRLLDNARDAGARLEAAERQVEAARAEYHALVRRMHLAGATLREIAGELGISHQRVQQMVDGAGGSWWRRIWRSRNATQNLVCTFCERPDSEVAKLIAGPGVFICDRCVSGAQTGMGLARCAFCHKRRARTTPDHRRICGECLAVCRQILLDSAS